MLFEPPSTLPILALAVLLAGMLSLVTIGRLLPSLQKRALAVPDHRSSHSIVTPQGAGIGWVAATLVVSVGLVSWSGLFSREWLFLFAALVGLSFLGFIDDINPLDWRKKLVAQSLLAGICLLALPRIDGPIWLQVPAFLAIAMAFITLINFTNFVDGIDEITAAHGIPALAVPVALASFGILSPFQGIVAASGLGALIGFWWWNRHPARIFLGDAGSLPLGLFLAWSALLICHAGYPVAALLSITYPVLDAGLTLLRRWWSGARLTQPHRDHAFQRAVDRGLPARTVTGIVLLVSMTNAVLAIISSLGSPVTMAFCLLAGCIVGLVPILAWLMVPSWPVQPGDRL